MVLTWITVAIVGVGGILSSVLAFRIGKKTKTKLASASACLLLATTICVGLLWQLYGTESGKRMVKSFQSNVQGGIHRTVRVFDVNGGLIAEYSGRFDVDSNSERIIFDDESGKRHMIFYSTATVIIDEK